MPKPRVTLHIFSSLDGRITGQFGQAAQAQAAAQLFKDTGFNDGSAESLHFDGWIYGKNTSVEGFGNRLVHFTDDVAVPAGDFITSQGAERYYVAIDRKGEIGWRRPTATYGGQEATVIEVLTAQAGNGYKAFLRRQEIPYMIAGEKEIDFQMMLAKLARDYGRQNLMLGGGGILNWTFLDQGLVDEISVVMAPVVDGATNTARLFNGAYAGDTHPVAFRPAKIKTYQDGTLWLRYLPLNHNKEEN